MNKWDARRATCRAAEEEAADDEEEDQATDQAPHDPSGHSAALPQRTQPARHASGHASAAGATSLFSSSRKEVSLVARVRAAMGRQAGVATPTAHIYRAHIEFVFRGGARCASG